MHQLERMNYDSVPIIRKKKTMGSRTIGSFGYKLSAMGSGFLSSHFSQQSVLKLPAIIVITDASMNMKSSLGKDLRQIGTKFFAFYMSNSTNRFESIKFADHANNKISDPNWNVFGTINESTFRFTIFAL
uniref:Uncharacterized protein n=1 Tax=Wuchereria bancrofti TaxID=6293 RepID=A0AAF5PL06_WUCBA